MASTPNHAVQGALFALVLFKLLAALNLVAGVVVVAVITTLSAVAGALPDLIGWFGRLANRYDWSLYSQAHDGAIARTLRWIPPYELHLQVDRLFHDRDDGNWWPRMWWAEIFLWALNKFLVYWLWT
jgi:hypothetical protein